MVIEPVRPTAASTTSGISGPGHTRIPEQFS